MKPTTLTVEQCREMDRRAAEEFHIPSILLMESAGRGLAEVVERSLIPPISVCSVAIFCGGGNNGGDGFVTARYLHHRSIPVSVFLTADPASLKGDALANYRIISAVGIPCAPL